MSESLAGIGHKIIVARLGSPFGVKGWIKLQSFTEPEDNVFSYPGWHWQGRQDWTLIQFDAKAKHGKGWVVHLLGYDTPEDVRFLAGLNIAVERSALPNLEADEFYLADLIGFQVINQEAVLLGQVTGFFDSGAHELLVLKGEKEYMIPFIRDRFVKSVDLDSQKILVDWDADF